MFSRIKEIFGGCFMAFWWDSGKIESISGLLEEFWSGSGPESDQKSSKVVLCGQRRVQGPGAIALVEVNSQLLISLLGQKAATCCQNI